MKHKNLGKMLGITLAAVSMFAGSVGAAEAVQQTEEILETEVETEQGVDGEMSPLEELNAILKQQKEAQKTSMLSDYLGTDALKQAMKENGFEFKSNWGLQEGTLETLTMDLGIFENPYAELGFMWDPVEKRWNLSIGGGTKEEAAVSAWLYGDTEKLLLGCEPFYDGAIGIEAGSFLDQYVGSALESLLMSMMDAPDISEIPDFDLIFYPENVDLSIVQEPLEEMKEKFQKEIEELEDSLAVEKESNEEEVIYHMTCKTEDILDIYQFFFNEFIAVSLDMGAMDYEEALEANEEIMDFMEEAEEVLGEGIVVNFVTQDNLLSSINYSVSVCQESYYYDEEDVLQSKTVESVIYYEIAFADPADPAKTFDVYMDMHNSTDEESMISIWMTKQTEETDTTSETSLSLMVKEDGDVLYWGMPYVSTFNGETGELDMTVSMAEDGEELMSVTLESTYTDVVKGESFVWNLDGLSMEVEGENIGLTGTVAVSSGVKDSYEPENVVMVCEATQGQLFTVMSEVMMNAQEWMEQLEPETEIAYESVWESETEAVMNY